uniref:Uncharacterized protein n=1 Tax=Megaselia scalaris TaxID=36166 RepID=T1GWB3_MEGSC
MVEKNLQPWERIGWSEDTINSIYREWGCYYFMRSTNLEIAIHYLQKALDLKENDAKSSYYLSLVQKYVALCESAYQEAIRALRLVDLNFPININVCNILYDMNQLEHAGVEYKYKSRKFVGQKVEPFEEKFNIVTHNLMDSIGDALAYFIRDYKKYFYKKHLENPDERPLWKILREKEECDILSILEVIEPLIHPRERARLDEGYNVFCTTYLNRSAIDVKFLKGLTTNKTLLLPQFKSTEILKDIVESKYHTVIKFLRMLQARSPLYNEKKKGCPNRAMCKKAKEDSIFRKRNMTRRVCIIVLKKIKELRERGNIHELTNYVEEIMGDYIVLKTHKMLPWKFEFINEVHNILALAYMDSLIIAHFVSSFSTEEEQLFVMMHLPLYEEVAVVEKFVFGDKSTWVEPDAIDYAYIKYKKITKRLEMRLNFVEYPIEKCYLFHEIGRHHLMQNKFEECIAVARKAVEESNQCNNNVWKFLATLMICKSHIAQHKMEVAKDGIENLLKVADLLGDQNILRFVKVADLLVSLILKKKRISQRPEKSRYQSEYSTWSANQSDDAQGPIF